MTLTPEQLGVVKAVFHFRQSCGDDYYSTRVASHFLLHAKTGFKGAQIARLLKQRRPTASRQQGVFSQETIQSAHRRLAGRPYGKFGESLCKNLGHHVVTVSVSILPVGATATRGRKRGIIDGAKESGYN